MSKKIYVLKDGECEKQLTTAICLGTNDKSEYPVREDGSLVELSAWFSSIHEGKGAYITEDPEEIKLITKYLMNTQNPYFYDLDNPTNSRAYYTDL